MTTHVFIVDHSTFKVHLEYLFAGTGGNNKFIDFNNQAESKLHHSTERTFISMMSDASRIRKHDNILFYLQQNRKQGIHEGTFYGVFKATNDNSFLDNNDDDIYLKDKLTKNLNFRTIIEPYKVYAKGVTEWEALDEIKGIKSPPQMLWSLIYRKLKGNRGNTMITLDESKRLHKLISDKNKGKIISHQNKILSFNKELQEIEYLDKKPNKYEGRQEKINILPRLQSKFHKGPAFEAHLQAYITNSLGLGINKSLDDTILQKQKMEWLGNEVSCGVGMQRIDIMVAVKDAEKNICIPIELKATTADMYNVYQIQRYVDWIEQYYINDKSNTIQPILITKELSNKNNNHYEELIKSFDNFNQHNENINKLKYVEYAFDNDDLIFNEIEY